MKKKHRNFIFLQYLKQYKLTCIILLFFTFLFCFFAFLYNYQWEVIIYSFFIMYFLLGILACIHFYFYYQKHCKLLHMKNQVTISLEQLPPPSTILEKDYQMLLHTLLAAYQTMLTTHSQKQEEMFNYYSLWIHQVKTPIASMQLLLETDQQNNDEKILELKKIEQYVDMVLQYLRLEDMASDLVIAPCEIDSILHIAIKKQALFFINKKITLDYTPVHTQIITDAKWFTLVIEQILSNCLKYTTDGSISIYVDEHQRLVIEDTGIGIYEADLPRVFEKGFTGYNGRLQKKSTGIGLYLCKKIMDNLQHEITITSTVGIGTKVSISLQQKQLLFE